MEQSNLLKETEKIKLKCKIHNKQKLIPSGPSFEVQLRSKISY